MSLRLNADNFSGWHDGLPIALLRLQNKAGMEVAVCNLGAKVLQILLPGHNNVPDDVALGYGSLHAVQTGIPSLGAFIGRYAGRIAHSSYTLDGVTYHLQPNNGAHCIHGGPQGSRHRVFQVQQHTNEAITLQLRFEPHIDQHPGCIDVTLRYQLQEPYTLVVEHEAVMVDPSGVASPASFTPHIYFNLDGATSPSIDNHWLQVNATHTLETDADNIATGSRIAVQGRTLDLRQPQCLGGLPDFDHAYEVRPPAHTPPHTLHEVAHAYSHTTGRTLTVCTTEPVLQVYTCETLVDHPFNLDKNGRALRPRMGLCLEPQQYPNAMNCSAFPLQRVSAQQAYYARTEYRFGSLN